MTDHSERDEAAWAYANGIDNEVWESLSPPEIDFLAFIAGADWAVKNDPRVLKLVEALRLLLMDTQHDDHMCNEETCPVLNANQALTEWSKP